MSTKSKSGFKAFTRLQCHFSHVKTRECWGVCVLGLCLENIFSYLNWRKKVKIFWINPWTCSFIVKFQNATSLPLQHSKNIRNYLINFYFLYKRTALPKLLLNSISYSFLIARYSMLPADLSFLRYSLKLCFGPWLMVLCTHVRNYYGILDS